jgi:hypothetical protein
MQPSTLAQLARSTAQAPQDAVRSDGGQHLLDYRAAAARNQLLEIAALLEHAHNPEPKSVAKLRHLLTDDTSPLYDPSVDPRALHATLTEVRRGLRRQTQ